MPRARSREMGALTMRVRDVKMRYSGLTKFPCHRQFAVGRTRPHHHLQCHTVIRPSLGLRLEPQHASGPSCGIISRLVLSLWGHRQPTVFDPTPQVCSLVLPLSPQGCDRRWPVQSKPLGDLCPPNSFTVQLHYILGLGPCRGRVAFIFSSVRILCW